MKSDLLKYKHYFIAIAALLVGLYITDPLWLLTIRFNGAPLCLVTATKAIELLKPTVRFKEYTYNGRSFTGNPTDNINADVDLIMWNNTQTSPEQKEQE